MCPSILALSLFESAVGVSQGVLARGPASGFWLPAPLMHQLIRRYDTPIADPLRSDR
jgi:hypothetical protein